jgi:hypothetical protein
MNALLIAQFSLFPLSLSVSQYAPCCSSRSACIPVSHPSSQQWGRYCLTATAKPVYKKGERCAGARGHPYVRYGACVSGYSCKKNRSMGWGSFCISNRKAAPRCAAAGKRCAGASGRVSLLMLLIRHRLVSKEFYSF